MRHDSVVSCFQGPQQQAGEVPVAGEQQLTIQDDGANLWKQREREREMNEAKAAEDATPAPVPIPVAAAAPAVLILDGSDDSDDSDDGLDDDSSGDELDI